VKDSNEEMSFNLWPVMCHSCTWNITSLTCCRLLSPVAWRHVCCKVVMQYPTSSRDHPVNTNVSAFYLVYFTMNMAILTIIS